MRGDNKRAADSFPERLKEAMERKGVNANQIQVAMARLGYHLPRQTIGNMLRGRTKIPRWDKLVQLSSYLGVRPEWLADGVQPMTPAPNLEDAEVQLVHWYRALSSQHKRDLCDIAERWADTDSHEDHRETRRGFDHRPTKQ